MKFNDIDNTILDKSMNTLDLVKIDEVKENIESNYPAFIIQGDYIKTITKFPWVDFFNLPIDDQEEKLQYWMQFLASLKMPTQIFVVAKKIDTNKYLEETLNQVKNTPYLTDNIKKRIEQGLPQTLDYIKRDWEASSYKKEYYFITSCKVNFRWNLQEDVVNEDDTTDFQRGSYKPVNEIQWKVFNEEFNKYYIEIAWILSGLLEQGREMEPLTSEEEVIWLLAELNNDIPRESINDIKNIL